MQGRWISDAATSLVGWLKLILTLAKAELILACAHKRYKDGHELRPGDVYQLSGANSLGVYSCIATNCMGSSESTAKLTFDDIQHQLSDDEKAQLKDANLRPPTFTKGLLSTEAKQIGRAHV